MKKIIVCLLAVVVMLSACATQTEISPTFESDVPQIAVVLPIQKKSDPMANDVMISINRLAQEFNGTIKGQTENVDFGNDVVFTILTTTANPDEESNRNIINRLKGYRIGQYDIVIGSGFDYIKPFSELCDSYRSTNFIGVDFLFNLDRSNLLSLTWNTKEPSFIAGALAAERFSGQKLGAIGGMDLPFIWDEFINPFIEGIEYMDGITGANTHVVTEIAGSFTEPRTGYRIAQKMFDDGVQCIYNVAGGTGEGILDAARDQSRWAIGVDHDQGLQRALKGEPSQHILTSVQKKWGEGVYLACREYLITGTLPTGNQFVGFKEGCADLAINPYNTPILGDQLETIEMLANALIEGELPSTLDTTEEDVWTAVSTPPGASIITVNAPSLFEGVPKDYGPMLQDALSTEFHNTGVYKVIDRDQVERLLAEVKFSLEGLSDASTQMEVGRLVSAEAIVFVNLGFIGEKLNVDCKMVNVETGLTIAATRETYTDFENALDNVVGIVNELSAN